MFTVPTGMNLSSQLNGFCLLSCGPGYKYPGYPFGNAAGEGEYRG